MVVTVAHDISVLKVTSCTLKMVKTENFTIMCLLPQLKKKMIWPQMSVVPRLSNPGFSKEDVGVSLSCLATRPGTGRKVQERVMEPAAPLTVSLKAELSPGRHAGLHGQESRFFVAHGCD